MFVDAKLLTFSLLFCSDDCMATTTLNLYKNTGLQRMGSSTVLSIYMFNFVMLL